MQAAPAPNQAPRFAESTSLGLFGLAIGCAALLPLAFGIKGAFAPEALRTTALFCLVFGGGCQLLAGLMDFANKNMLGATLFTTFSFNWIINAWVFNEASQGRGASSLVILSVDICFLVIFLVMTYAFAFFSKSLLLFLLDIDVLYGLRIAREVLHMPSLGLPIAIAVVVLMVIALYLAFSLALANAAGRVVLPIGGPVFQASTTPASPVSASVSVAPASSSAPSVPPVYAASAYAGPNGTAQYRAVAG